ncbi:hypothetical protein Rsub_05910 [Raphidocelis subcapitata]|uniref:Uncharacterized protein n=1 Tax=Raphidocelis subcapitata TaxID=307507 RepID=A0A2V0NZW2_9CHLO|nr:hypothetical protein Rsub_05910 [Raphidocelis subcapitata]|eukprot:GBF93178.1 hypothetical protein Rsub_05910 [Raphidocelis subcapitata]
MAPRPAILVLVAIAAAGCCGIPAHAASVVPDRAPLADRAAPRAGAGAGDPRAALSPAVRDALAAWAATCEAGVGGARRPLLIAAPDGAPPPRRRTDGEPPLSLAPPAAGAPPPPPAAALAVRTVNALLLAAEGALLRGRRFFAMRLEFQDLRAAAAAAAGAGAACGPRGQPGPPRPAPDAARAAAAAAAAAAAPLAVFDASAATITVDSRALGPLAAAARGAPEQAAAAARLAGAAVSSAAAARAGPLAAALPALAAAAAAGVPAALLAAPAAAGALGASVWFCIACVAALGLLCPLIINYMLGEAAQLACEKLSLDTDQCLDLFVGALAVALVLSLLSAVPIFKACRLSECAQHSKHAAAE